MESENIVGASPATSRSMLASAKDSLAQGLEMTADTLHDRAPEEGAWEQAAADRLRGWSEGLRDWDVDAAEARVREHIVRRPGVALLAAAAVGFCIGLCLRKD